MECIKSIDISNQLPIILWNGNHRKLNIVTADRSEWLNMIRHFALLRLKKTNDKKRVARFDKQRLLKYEVYLFFASFRLFLCKALCNRQQTCVHISQARIILYWYIQRDYLFDFVSMIR